jgi:hypothetical protein
MVELLGMLLDFLDALAGAVTIAYWWCTWVSPSRPATPLRTKAQPSDPSEIDRFLLAARACPSAGGYLRDDLGRAGSSAAGSSNAAAGSL